MIIFLEMIHYLPLFLLLCFFWNSVYLNNVCSLLLIFVLCFLYRKIVKMADLVERAENLLRRVFRLEHFREEQLNIIIAMDNLYSTFNVLATGYGKSLIFEIAALLSEGKVTIIISPLISLMQDMSRKLKSLRVTT